MVIHYNAIIRITVITIALFSSRKSVLPYVCMIITNMFIFSRHFDKNKVTSTLKLLLPFKLSWLFDFAENVLLEFLMHWSIEF